MLELLKVRPDTVIDILNLIARIGPCSCDAWLDTLGTASTAHLLNETVSKRFQPLTQKIFV